MAKRQSTTERTSGHDARRHADASELDDDRSRPEVVPDQIDEARAQAHERARQRSGSDD
jgi:hypothetical protein